MTPSSASAVSGSSSSAASGSGPHDVGHAETSDLRLPAVFLSRRMHKLVDGVPLREESHKCADAESLELRVALEKDRTVVFPAVGDEGEDKVRQRVKACDVFVIFGTANYGVDTGHLASTYHEFKWARQFEKKIVHINMVADEARGTDLARVGGIENEEVADWMRHASVFWVAWEWTLVHTPMPDAVIAKVRHLLR